MLKKLACLLFVLAPTLCWAAGDDEDGMSDECLRSLQDLYKFYYHEIQPNPKHLNAQNEQKLGSTETLQMQVVIGQLKKNCSPNTVARINENLKTESGGKENA